MQSDHDKDRQDRRDFLRTASLIPLALALGCSRSSSPAEIEAALRKFILAVGPWDHTQREDADEFATKFLAARGQSFRAQGETAVALASKDPIASAPMALPELDLSKRSPAEKQLLTDFVAEIYSLIDVHYSIAGRPPLGQSWGRIEYTRPPGEWKPPYGKGR